jgi:hypothetical protein
MTLCTRSDTKCAGIAVSVLRTAVTYSILYLIMHTKHCFASFLFVTDTTVTGRVLDDAFSEITITVIMCYSAFLLAEATSVSFDLCLQFKCHYNNPQNCSALEEPKQYVLCLQYNNCTHIVLRCRKPMQ